MIAPLVSFMMSGLVVDAAAPDALCPSLAQTRSAVAARVGEVESQGKGQWRALYTLQHEVGSERRDVLLLELRDSNDKLVLRRELPLQQNECHELPQVIAMVLERFFRDPGREPAVVAAPATAESSPQGAAEVAAPPPVVDHAGKTNPAKSKSDAQEGSLPPSPIALRASNTAWWVGVGGGYGSAVKEPVVALQLGLASKDRWLVRGTAFSSLRKNREALTVGSVARSRYDLALLAAPHWVLGDCGLHLGAQLGVALETGRGEGLTSDLSGWRLLWAPGIGAGASWQPHARLGIQLDGIVGWQPSFATRAFEVSGNEVLRPQPFVGALTLSASWFSGQ